MLIIYTLTEGEFRNKDARAEEYIRKMADGDVSAMGELYELIQTDVYAYALSKTANRELAEDIAHDTLVSVWKNAKQYTPHGKPLAWIFTIELNLIRKNLNHNRRYVQFDESIANEADDADFTENVINNEFLRQLLALLNEEERELIALHAVSGLKFREIAKLLGKPLSTVLSKYNRAIKKLQAEIKEKEGE